MLYDFPLFGGYMDTAVERGHLLKTYLKRAGVSQKELAERLGVTDSYVSRMGAGHVDWTNSKYFGQIASYLRLRDDEVKRLQPAVVVEFSGPEPQPSGGESPTILVPPNLQQALSILSAEDAAYSDRIFAEKLAMMDPEDGDADPPVSVWIEVAKSVMRLRKFKR